MDDEALARKLQAEFDAEGSSPPPASSYASSSRPGRQPATSFPSRPVESTRPSSNFETGSLTRALPHSTFVTIGAPGYHRDVVEYTNSICRTSCAGCRCALVSTSKDVEDLFQLWFSIPVSSILSCKGCKKYTCCGCGKSAQSSISTTNKIKVENDETMLYWCCDNGRIFIIWVLLCGFDRSLAIEKSKTEAASKHKVRVYDGSNGVGYGGAGGFGYAAMRRERASEDAAHRGKARAAAHLSAEDTLTDEVLMLVNPLLPNQSKSTNFDRDAPANLLSMLSTSHLANKIAELLRNDSLEDINRRAMVYVSALEFVRRVVTSASLNTVVVDERDERPMEVNLLTVSFGTAAKGKSKATDKARSVAACLRELHTQAEMLLQQAKQSGNAKVATQHMKPFLDLCKSITEVYNFIPKNKTSAATQTQTWTQWQKDRSMLSVSLPEITKFHHYLDPIALRLNPELSHMPVLHGGSGSPARTKRLMMELASLKTSLPPGIFVRYSDARLDLMKILTVGPGETPYENGLITFDLYCPPKYPQVPPMVNCATSKRHNIGYNPNLYDSGKVCLSLLGTWEGEPWRPGESTILQVLLSIQGLILNSQPFTNEPAMANSAGTPQSDMFNSLVAFLTLKHAILPFLEDSPREDPLWRDIARKHLKQNATNISKFSHRWMEQSARFIHHPGTPRMMAMFAKGQSLMEWPAVGKRVRAGLEKVSGLKLEAPNPPAVFQQWQHTQGIPPGQFGGRYGVYGAGRGGYGY